MIWQQTEFRLDPNQSENKKYKPISVNLRRNPKVDLCVSVSEDIELQIATKKLAR